MILMNSVLYKNVLYNNPNKKSIIINNKNKRYGLWKDIIKTPNKSLFIVLLRNYSEIDFVLKELKDHQSNEWDDIHKLIIEKDFLDNSNESKKYEIIYTHKKSNRKITILIATIGYFYYNIAEMDKNNESSFSSLYRNFLKNPYKKINDEWGFWFLNKFRNLDKNTTIYFYESNILEPIHLECINKLIVSFNIRCNINW